MVVCDERSRLGHQVVDGVDRCGDLAGAEPWPEAVKRRPLRIMAQAIFVCPGQSWLPTGRLHSVSGDGHAVRRQFVGVGALRAWYTIGIASSVWSTLSDSLYRR